MSASQLMQKTMRKAVNGEEPLVVEYHKGSGKHLPYMVLYCQNPDKLSINSVEELNDRVVNDFMVFAKICEIENNCRTDFTDKTPTEELAKVLEELEWAKEQTCFNVSRYYADEVYTNVMSLIAKKTNKPSGHVYIMGNEEYGWYKIGYTTNPQQLRFTQVNSSLPFDMDFFETVYVYDPLENEQLLHKLWKHKHVKGEWFSLDEEDISNIKDYLKPYKVS